MSMQIEKGTRYETADGKRVRVVDVHASEYCITEDDEVLTTPLVEYYYESQEVADGLYTGETNTKSVDEFRLLLDHASGETE